MRVKDMKMKARNKERHLLAALIFMVFSHQANAVCSRDDVSFYLDKGFSTSQITALCSTPSPTSAADTDKPQDSFQNSEQSPVQIESDALFLKRAIKAKKVSLSSDSLQYTRELCIEYGEEDLYGFTPKVCPNVIFSIALKNLDVVQTGKRYYFYGTPEVKVKSTIKREIMGDLRDMKPEERALVLEKFEKGNVTSIPVRDDFSLEKVSQVLQKLSN